VEALGGPVVISAVVLALAGARKLMDPASTQGALREMGLPWRGPIVAALAVGEILVGVAVLAVGGTLTLLALAAWYLGFAAFVAVALRRDVPLASCGCIGKEDTPPTWVHLAIDLFFGVVALVAAFDPYGSVVDLLDGQPWAGVPLIGYVAVGVYLTYVALAVLPVTLEAARLVRAPARSGPG
jgi:hypothetical protein